MIPGLFVYATIFVFSANFLENQQNVILCYLILKEGKYFNSLPRSLI